MSEDYGGVIILSFIKRLDVFKLVNRIDKVLTVRF